MKIITIKQETKLATEAERIIRLTETEARELPGFLKRVVPNMFIINGWYGCTLDGVKTLYLPKFN